jgi:putative transposase
MRFDTFEDTIKHLPRFVEEVYNKRRHHSAPGYLSPQQFEDHTSIRQTCITAARSVSTLKGSLQPRITES